jgi:hypothetical protein
MLLQWLALASSLHKRKGLHSANKCHTLTRGFASARQQKLTFHKFRTDLTLLFKLPYNHCISMLSFMRQKASSGELRATIPETRHITIHTRRSNFRNLICSCFFHYYFVQPRTFSKELSFRWYSQSTLLAQFKPVPLGSKSDRRLRLWEELIPEWTLATPPKSFGTSLCSCFVNSFVWFVRHLLFWKWH